jgi:hypothetical protein
MKVERNRDRDGKNAANALFVDTESSGLEPGQIWWKSVLQSTGQVDTSRVMYEHLNDRNYIRILGET